MIIKFTKYVIKPKDNPSQFMDEDYCVTERIDEALLFDSKEIAEYYRVEKIDLRYCASDLFEVVKIQVGYEYNV